MDKKEELQRRIARGQYNINRLSAVASALPHGDKRDELADKSVRMLHSLAALQDSFESFYPGNCLFMPGRICASKNKGMFHCVRCPDYLNAIYGVEGQQPLTI
jgi:hypothetical protein